MPLKGGFEVTLRHAGSYRCRKILLSTGVVDRVPAIPSVEHFYNRSVHHCPYCDGWEKRKQPLAAYSRGEKGCGLALLLTLWSRDIVLCTDGPAELSDAQRRQLAQHGIAVHEEPISCLEGTSQGVLERVVFVTGTKLARRALFFNTGQTQRSSRFARLRCNLTAKGGIENSDTAVYRTITIPSALKWEVRDKLDQANITERVLYPGLDGLSRWLQRSYMPHTTKEDENLRGFHFDGVQADTV